MDWILFLLPLDNPAALYGVFFGLIYISAFGLPIPEEVVLLLAGYLAYLGFADFWTTIFVLSGSIVIADLSGYLLGRYAGDFLYEKILGRFEITRELVEKGKKYIDRFGEKVIVCTRPISGVRFVVPIMMGHFRMNVKKFIMYDLAATLPYTLILISLSYYLGSVFTLIANIDIIKRVIGWAIAAIVVLMLILRYIKKRRMRTRA
ncbi:MAG: DedA family protein [bacterium]|nr:DedA family protein [bacterium]MDZ4286210.1 DedA family protein [Candidatus Sungbacteria bacterium]